MQHFNQPVTEIIQKRRSVRTYEKKNLDSDIIADIENYISNLEIPFKNKVKIKYISYSGREEGQKLGTYGVIKNAPAFLGMTVEKGEDALAAAGYALEKVILYATARGLGTCWLGGTFKRGIFAEVMEVKNEELFPAITPIGYIQEKGHVMGNMIRKIAKADGRKPWEELFFYEDLQTALTKAQAESYEDILEAVRIAPSASNKQPWRIVKEGKTLHFYLAKTPGYNEKLGYTIQEVDLGIALCHAHLMMEEKGLKVTLEKLAEKKKQLPQNMEYIASLKVD